MMKETGLPKDFSGALTAASAVAGPTIPPSVAMVVFAQAVGGGLSISGLFMSGVLPGILLGLVLIIMSFVYVHRKSVAPYITVLPAAAPKELHAHYNRSPKLGLRLSPERKIYGPEAFLPKCHHKYTLPNAQ